MRDHHGYEDVSDFNYINVDTLTVLLCYSFTTGGTGQKVHKDFCIISYSYL